MVQKNGHTITHIWHRSAASWLVAITVLIEGPKEASRLPFFRVSDTPPYILASRAHHLVSCHPLGLPSILHRWNEFRTRPVRDDYNRELRWRWRGGRLEVRILARLYQVLCAHTHTRKGPDKLKLEQRLKDSGASTASPGEHLEFHPSARKYSSKLTSDKLYALPGAPIHTTDTHIKRGHRRVPNAFTRTSSLRFQRIAQFGV